MKVTVLGCGASGGVPLVGCNCPVCRSNDPKNQRLRSSIMIEADAGARLLVDSSPDLRQQLLRAEFNAADAVLYTHEHADHSHGIDDLRAVNFHRNAPLDIYGSQECIDLIARKFPYTLAVRPPGSGWSRPYLVPHVVGDYERFTVAGVTVQTFLQYHGKWRTLGYRIGNFAYSTDVNNLPEQSLQLLESLDVWIVDCLRLSPSPTHAHLEMTLDWIAQLKPKRAILTHMAHELEYHELLARLPANVEPAFDGMVVTL